MSNSFPMTDTGRGGIRYAQGLLAHWKLIVGLVVLAVGSAALFTALAAKRYEASADVYVTPVSATDTLYQGFHVFRQSLDGSSSVVTAARVMGTPQIRRQAFAALPGKGAGVSINIVPLSQADVVAIQATAPSAVEAADAANKYAHAIVTARTALFQSDLKVRIDQLNRQIALFPVAARQNNFTYASLQQQLAQLRGVLGLSDPTLQVTDPAVPPSGASWPRPKLSIAISFLVALLLGCGVAVFLEATNPRVSSETDLTHEHRLPILTRVPSMPRRAVEKYLMRTAPLPPGVWKSYQTLRAVLATAGSDRGYPKSILVTSASASDGKTMTALNLAITLANADLRVLLIDADFHRPMVATIFDVKVRRDGFIRMLRGEATLEQSSIPAAGYPGLRLVLAGSDQLHTASILESDRVAKLFRELEREADVIVIDAPPVPEVAEALWVAAAVEIVLLCVRLGHTRRDRLAELRDLLGRRGVTPLGFVVTTRERPEPDDYGAYAQRRSDGPRARIDAAAKQTDGAVQYREPEAPARRRP